MARQVFDQGEKLGYHFTLLDIGGGYPGATGSYEVFDKVMFVTILFLKNKYCNSAENMPQNQFFFKFCVLLCSR